MHSESCLGTPGGKSYDHILDFLMFGLFGASTGPGRYLMFVLVKVHVECNQNHVWGSPGARVKSIIIEQIYLDEG